MLILLPHHVGVTTIAARKKIGAERCESVFDAHTLARTEGGNTPPFVRKGIENWWIYLHITRGFSQRKYHAIIK